MNNKKPNRLINEKSPYLLQHAYNPVDWHSWSDEAFTRAASEDKPVFLSIGYSTCHWCHVMERESFEDEKVAEMMNEAFVSIKLDREERPDIDAMYMTVCQMMTGGGGWPLTVILTPDKKPFFAGTYFPKASNKNRAGMLDLIPRIQELWKNNRDELLSSANEITEHLVNTFQPQFGNQPEEKMLIDAFEKLQENFDHRHSGFGNAPKFPSPHNLIFLLRYSYRTKSEEALEMAEKTLRAMRRGGIYDQVGGGFHRYSTDAGWLVPHFEKMLYDQAMIMYAFVEAYALTGKAQYRDTASEIAKYVKSTLTDANGGFYSAEDADSEGEEGKFYLWQQEEIDAVLGKRSDLFSSVFNTSEGGNFTDAFKEEQTGENILYLEKDIDEMTDELKVSKPELLSELENCRDTLYAAREKRIHPFKDDKILTDWNGLMIAALAYGGSVINDPDLIAMSEKAATFIIDNMLIDENKLLHRYRQGEAAINGTIEDYAYFIWGLIELYQATFKVRYLKTADNLAAYVVEHFKDKDSAGFFFTSDEAEKLLVRQKEVYDGAIPSANSVMISNLWRLSHLTGEFSFEYEAMLTARAFSEIVQRQPSAFSFFLCGVMHLLSTPYEIVVAGELKDKESRRFLREIITTYNPNKVVLFKEAGEQGEELNSVAPFVEGMRSIEDSPTIYFCKNFECSLPSLKIEDIISRL